jgi:ABC-type dipeptide/oligopeptide/nickel transport system permease subunit
MSLNNDPGMLTPMAAAQTPGTTQPQRRGGLVRDTIGNVLPAAGAHRPRDPAVLRSWPSSRTSSPLRPQRDMLDIGDGSALSPPCIHLLGCPPTSRSITSARTATSGTCSAAWSGTRISLVVGFIAVGVAILVGALLGAIAGFAKGSSDNLIMRIMDVLLVFPALILAILIVT